MVNLSYLMAGVRILAGTWPQGSARRSIVIQGIMLFVQCYAKGLRSAYLCTLCISLSGHPREKVDASSQRKHDWPILEDMTREQNEVRSRHA